MTSHSDDETYLSADDLRINLWNLSINDQSFNIVDIKPENMEELTEVGSCGHDLAGVWAKVHGRCLA